MTDENSINSREMTPKQVFAPGKVQNAKKDGRKEKKERGREKKDYTTLGLYVST